MCGVVQVQQPTRHFRIHKRRTKIRGDDDDGVRHNVNTEPNKYVNKGNNPRRRRADDDGDDERRHVGVVMFIRTRALKYLPRPPLHREFYAHYADTICVCVCACNFHAIFHVTLRTRSGHVQQRVRAHRARRDYVNICAYKFSIILPCNIPSRRRTTGSKGARMLFPFIFTLASQAHTHTHIPTHRTIQLSHQKTTSVGGRGQFPGQNRNDL